MLKVIRVIHVIIGHSERRKYYNETDETVNLKAHAAFDNNLTPIICVGESIEQREANETLNHIEFQIKQALANLTKDRKSTRLNSSHVAISYAVFCLKKKTQYIAHM